MGVRVVFPDMGKDPSVQLIEKTITENGTYDAITDGANGYSKVNVNVEGGGGGSSDFSTAKVTYNASNLKSLYIPIIAQGEEQSAIMVDSGVLESGSTYTVPLYKGFLVVTNLPDTTVEVSGDITYDSENDYIIIAGNGTITIS